MAGILYAEINVFAILIIGMIFWKLIKMKNKPKEHTLFAVLLVGAALFFCLDGAWALIDAGYIRAGYVVSYLINLLYFMIAGILPFVWLVYTVRSGANPEFGKKWVNAVLALPVLVFVCLLFTNHIGNWIFYIDETGKYCRGSIYFLQPLCSYGYFAIPAARTLVAFFKDGPFKNEKVSQSIISFVFVPIIFGILQIVFAGSPWLCIGITIAALQLYLYTLAADEMKHEREYQELLEKKNEDLQDALERAEAANKSKSIFLNSMSHDIRTPMNAILGFARIAKDNAGDKGKVEDCLNKVLSSGDYLLHLINEVLDMARIESGKVSIDEKVVSVRDVTGYLESLFRITMEQKALSFSVKTDIQDEFVYVDVLRLNQICMNLISNAQKYTKPGGNVWFDCKQIEKKKNQATYRFSVRDTGIGMSKSFQENLFGAFEREARVETGQIQGSGLGLAITKNIVDLMNGRIEVQSELGKGTEICVYLTFRIDEGNQIKTLEKELAEIDFTGKRILLAEDNELNSEIAQTILGEVGFLVDVAPDGAEAVKMLKDSEPGYYDLILMDIQMPYMNGYEAATTIRNCGVEGHKDIPIVAMTANAFEEDRKKAFECGMNEHIAKPVDVEKLISVLKVIL